MRPDVRLPLHYESGRSRSAPQRAADCLRTAFRIAYATAAPSCTTFRGTISTASSRRESSSPSQYRVDARAAAPSNSWTGPPNFAKAKNPVIVSGRGVVDSDALEIVKAIAEHSTAPVAVTYLHNDAFYGDHPLFVGPIGYMGSKAAMKTLAKADVMLAIGTRLSVFGTLPQYDINYFPENAKIIQVDVNPAEDALHPPHRGRHHRRREGSLRGNPEAAQG